MTSSSGTRSITRRFSFCCSWCLAFISRRNPVRTTDGSMPLPCAMNGFISSSSKSTGTRSAPWIRSKRKRNSGNINVPENVWSWSAQTSIWKPASSTTGNRKKSTYNPCFQQTCRNVNLSPKNSGISHEVYDFNNFMLHYPWLVLICRYTLGGKSLLIDLS